LKRLNHSQVCVWPTALSPNASLSILCFRRRLTEPEAEFYANLLLLHISNISRSVWTQNCTNTMSQKCTEKIHTSSQQNAAWQSGSQRVKIAIRSSTLM
jgi:hypothetical protein